MQGFIQENQCEEKIEREIIKKLIHMSNMCAFGRLCTIHLSWMLFYVL